MPRELSGRTLRDRAGNSPNNVRRALDKDPKLAVSIEELKYIEYRVREHETNEKSRFIVQAHPEFHGLLKEYRDRWSMRTHVDLMDWQDDRAGKERRTVLIQRLVERRVEASGGEKEGDQIRESTRDWYFYPDFDSPSNLIEEMVEYVGWSAETEPLCSRAVGAFEWMTNTVGLDLRGFEERWREFPVIIVQKKVSDRHGISDPRSLFAYLNNIRLAYMAGAYLAAIALCRASTEVLFRYHYNENDNDEKLTPLIRKTVEKREFSFLKKFNFSEKVEQANKILHTRDEIKNVDRQKAIVRDWIPALQELIARAPT